MTRPLKMKTWILAFLAGLPAGFGMVMESRPTGVDEQAAGEIARAVVETMQAARSPEALGEAENLAIRGEVMIQGAYRQFEKRNWIEGVRMLRTGLAWNPRDQVARLTLTDLQWLAGYPEAARRTAYEELSHGYPGRKYMEQLLVMARRGDEPERHLELLALALHGADPIPKADRAWLLREKASTLLGAERWDEALAFVRAYSDEMNEDDWRECGFIALCGARRFGEAEAWVGEWKTKSGASHTVLRFQARVYRESGQLGKMSAVLTELVRRNSADPQTRVFSIIQHLLAGMHEKAGEELDGFLFRFGAEPKNLGLIARPLAEIGRDQELAKIETAAAEQGIKDMGISVGRLELLIKAARWEEADAAITRMRRDFPAGVASSAGLFKSLTCLLRVIRANDGDIEARAALIAAMKTSVQTTAVYRDFVKALRVSGRTEAARLLAEQGLSFFEGSRCLKEALAELR